MEKPNVWILIAVLAGAWWWWAHRKVAAAAPAGPRLKPPAPPLVTAMNAADFHATAQAMTAADFGFSPRETGYKRDPLILSGGLVGHTSALQAATRTALSAAIMQSPVAIPLRPVMPIATVASAFHFTGTHHGSGGEVVEAPPPLNPSSFADQVRQLQLLRPTTTSGDLPGNPAAFTRCPPGTWLVGGSCSGGNRNPLIFA